MSDSKAGFLAKVELSSGNEILGASSYSYTGESRDMHESTHFDETGHKIDTPLMISGGEITVSGDFRLNDVSGQDAVKAQFITGSPLRDFRLYVDQTSYYIPDPSLFVSESEPGSYVTITKSPTNISFDTAGIGTMEFTAKVTGAMILVNASSDIIIQTIGRVQDARISDVTFIGKLLSAGDPSQNSDVDLSFRYGTNKNVLNSETEVFSAFSDLGFFGVWQSDVITSTAVIFYQAVGVGHQNSAKTGIGAILSDTIYSDIANMS